MRAVISDWFFWVTGPLVFASRWMVMSSPYFGDSPRLIQAAENHTYVIQPPGYWLYARLAGLFSDPAFALSLINAVTSALGAIAFYLLCLQLTTRIAARLATAAYASVYFVWFAGAVQVSYAGELLFTPLLLLFMLRCIERPALPLLCGVAATYAIAAGVRPPDGVFLLPLFIYFACRYVNSWKHRLLMIATAGLFCLLWYIPQHIALARSGATLGGQLWSVAKNEAPILHPFSKLALSNIVRTVFPLLLAFWSLLPAILVHGNKQIRLMLCICLIPGLAFFALVYISDATYLCFLAPAIICLAIAAPPRRLLYCGLAACFAWNVLFFCAARPVDETRNLAVAIYSVSGARYCVWALKHQWYRTLNTYTQVPAIRSERNSHRPD